jgi:DNA-binding Lrp family transcriptional regulator
MIDLMDETAAKIVLAVQRGDSINRVASKIGVSYSWVYDWIKRLEEAEIITNTDSGIQIVDHEMRQQYAEMMAALYSRSTISQEDAYVIPHFAGMEFAYTEIDAAYVWTHGGYQIARSHDDYPVFIEVHDRDIERWIAFFEQFGVETTINERPDADEVDGNVHYVLYPETDGIDAEWVDGNPVIPLDNAVDQMMENRPAYEPALEIIAEEHHVDIDASHHSATAAD